MIMDENLGIIDAELSHEADEEAEKQFIVRLPLNVADRLSNAVSAEDLSTRMSLQMDDECRHGVLTFDEFILNGKILDLPTIIESIKTNDNVRFHKSADICQMMVCKLPEDCTDEKVTPGENPNKRYSWPHGITQPLKNVRRRRFRKVLKKKNVERTDIEDELKLLLRMDNTAVKVEFEVLIEDITPVEETKANEDNSDVLSESDSVESDEEKYLFGSRLSSTSSDEEYENDKPKEYSLNKDGILIPLNDFERRDDENNGDDENESDVNDSDNDKEESNRSEALVNTYEDLKNNYERRLREIETVDNPTLRLRMQANLEDLRAQSLELQDKRQVDLM